MLLFLTLKVKLKRQRAVVIYFSQIQLSYCIKIRFYQARLFPISMRLGGGGVAHNYILKQEPQLRKISRFECLLFRTIIIKIFDKIQKKYFCNYHTKYKNERETGLQRKILSRSALNQTKRKFLKFSTFCRCKLI